MPDFPGSENASPGSYSTTTTLSSGVRVPGGTRTAVIMGEGLKKEIIVSSANGSGLDGLNSSYSSTNGRDGRHFLLTNSPLISNRTTLYKNGIPLVGLEQAFTSSSSSFSSVYDYRINITNGRIELQTASLVDQGGSYYAASALNQGNGVINNLELLDENAVTETWTVRCVSIRRDTLGDPVDGYARFVAQGSVSGILSDGYGNPVIWQSNNVVVNNGVLSFSVDEGGTLFREGDKFTIKVKGGALTRGESLYATYIAETDINTPTYFTDPDQLTKKHGLATSENYLAIGAQLAWANSTPGIWAIQTAPAVPRRVSYTLEASASGSATADDLKFSLPLGVVPSVDYNINFFVTDPATDTESQIIPNKVDFYDAAFTASPNTFYFGSNVYSYTVILEDSVIVDADDGSVTASGVFTSATVTFDSSHVGLTLKILNPEAQAGEYLIVSVTDGSATLSGSFTLESSIEFQVIDSTQQTAAILFTDDLALTAGSALRCTVVDNRDADFFDVGWVSAYEALETIDVTMVVPLPSQTISAIFQNGRTHVETMSNVQNKKERVLFTGAISGLTPDHLLGTTNAAVEDIGILEGIQGDDVSEILAGNTEDLTDYSVTSAFGGTYRVVYFYPDEIVVQVGGDRLTLSGYFMSAAAAGFLSGVPFIAQPLTRKVLSGFTILSTKKLRPTVLNNLQASGVAVVEPVTGGGKVNWGRTTTSSGFPEEEELSIVFIRDRVSQALRNGLDSFVGTAEDEGLLGSVLTKADKIVKGLKGQKLITNYKNLRVVPSDVDPRQYNVSVQVRPAYSINWIYIQVEVGNI